MSGLPIKTLKTNANLIKTLLDYNIPLPNIAAIHIINSSALSEWSVLCRLVIWKNNTEQQFQINPPLSIEKYIDSAQQRAMEFIANQAKDLLGFVGHKEEAQQTKRQKVCESVDLT